MPEAPIIHKGIVYVAARCEKCGMKIYPVKDLAFHLAWHKLRDIQTAKWIHELTRKFKIMRN